jgi:hypothetical protein
MKISTAKEHIKTILRAKLVPMLHSSPAIGKSSVLHQICKEWQLYPIDIRLSQTEPVDLSGYPKVDGNKGTYLPMDMFPVEGDPIPEGYRGWVIILDEINSAPRSTIAAAYKVCLDRMVGMHKLHPNVLIAAAGNLDTDGAIVTPMGTAMQSRLIHLTIEPDITSWADWAERNNIDHRIVSYLRFKPSSLYKFDPNHTDKTYPAPRTWHFLDRILKVSKQSLRDLDELIQGTIGVGCAKDFLAYCEIYQELPTVDEMISNPETVFISDKPNILFAVSGIISEYANEKTISNLMTIAYKLPLEFQMIALKGVMKRNIKMLHHPVVQEWTDRNKDLISE